MVGKEGWQDQGTWFIIFTFEGKLFCLKTDLNYHTYDYLIAVMICALLINFVSCSYLLANQSLQRLSNLLRDPDMGYKPKLLTSFSCVSVQCLPALAKKRPHCSTFFIPSCNDSASGLNCGPKRTQVIEI